MKYNNITDYLLDEGNKEPLVLTGEDGKRFTFEQIAVIPHNKKIYAILKPIETIEGIKENEAVAFYVDESEGQQKLMVETDEEEAKTVFAKYYELLNFQLNHPKELEEFQKKLKKE